MTPNNELAVIRDNLLFGRVTFGIAGAEQKVMEVLRGTLQELDLEWIIHQVGLDYDVGPSGRLLFAPQRAAVSIARCLVSRPSVLIMDSALSAFGPADARRIISDVRAAMADKTLIITLAEVGDADGFDRVLEFEGPRYIGARKGTVEVEERGERPDDERRREAQLVKVGQNER
jgi:putative ABC transport system ATP-binding protein